LNQMKEMKTKTSMMMTRRMMVRTHGFQIIDMIPMFLMSSLQIANR
jgi:hypothetical protein